MATPLFEPYGSNSALRSSQSEERAAAPKERHLPSVSLSPHVWDEYSTLTRKRFRAELFQFPMILLAIDLFPAAWSAFFAGLLTGMLILFFTLLRK